MTSVTLLKRMLFRYQGHVSAALVLGGVDCTGAHLYHVYPHGSTSKLPYVTMGSGSLAAMAVFEQGWREDITEEEAIALVKDAILAGIFNDLGSGSNCDITIIRKGGETERIRGYEKPNDVARRSVRSTAARQPCRCRQAPRKSSRRSSCRSSARSSSRTPLRWRCDFASLRRTVLGLSGMYTYT